MHSDVAEPVPLTIAAGWFHACAVEDHRLFCWGRPDAIAWAVDAANGAEPTSRGYPLRDVAEVVAGVGATCARSSAGVTCWGDAIGAASPYSISGSAAIALVGVVGRTLLARNSTNQVAAWGDNHVGQLGDGSISDHRAPVPWPSFVGRVVTPGREWMDFSAGDVGVCGISEDRRAWCWGRSTQGRLPNVPEAEIAAAPIAVDGVPSATSIATGDAIACALTERAEIYCWGGRSPEDAPSATGPVRVDLPAATRSVHAGGAGACAVLVDGTAHCWGTFRPTMPDVDDCFLPEPDFLGTTREQPVMIARDVTALDVGFGFVCYRSSSRLFCFGSNTYGQLGRASSGWVDPPGVEVDLQRMGALGRHP